MSFRKDPSPSCGASSLMRHTTPSERKFDEKEDPLFQTRVYIRSEHCELSKRGKSLDKTKESTVKRATKPLKSNAPLSGSSKKRLISTVQK